jgi:hypothetical protein
MPFAAIIAATLLFTGCNKHDPGPDCYLQSCRISQLQNEDLSYGNESYTADFEYDAKGTPLRITRSDVRTGGPNYLFRHDAKNRVTDVIGCYGSGNDGDYFEFWHRLKYDAKNRVYRDSSFYVGIVGPNPVKVPGVEQIIIVNNYTYDTQNRIIRAAESDLYRDYHYYYNNRGNLDSVRQRDYTLEYTVAYGTYDNTVNYHRTNPLWQFLDRDYSQNNAATVSAVNKYSLPTTVAYSRKDYYYPYFLKTLYLNVAHLKYSCK